MAKLIFGIICLTITAFMTLLLYGTTLDVTVNGKLVPHEAVSTMLETKIYLGVFWTIGIFFFFKGIKETMKYFTINIKGEECFGKVSKIHRTAIRENGRRQLKADILVYIPSIQKTEKVSKIIGSNMYKYRKGSYIKLKYYNGDIDTKEVIYEFELPSDAKDQLKKSRRVEKDSN